MGALSFVGARLAAHLHGMQHVVAIESALLATMDKMWWYRWEQLAHSGLMVSLVNMTNQSAVRSMLLNYHPGSLIYIPPILEGNRKDYSIRLSEHLKEFVKLLEFIKDTAPCTAVVLVNSLPYSQAAGPVAVMSAWAIARMFELTLSTYHHLYDIPMSVLNVGGVYGPWQSHDQPHQCWYVSDVVKMIAVISRAKETCKIETLLSCQNTSRDQNLMEIISQYNLLGLTSLDDGRRTTKAWIQSHLKTSTNHRDVVFSSYFTSIEDSQRKRRYAKNRFHYMEKWVLSAKKLGLTTVVFHDGLSPDFQWRLQLFYHKLHFQYVPSMQGRSTNDARFYSYLAYLETHSDISRVLLTDISDVKFQQNPFDLMTQLGERNLYIGTDIDYYPDMDSMRWLKEKLVKCYGEAAINKGELSPLMKLSTVYNAGVIGGSRHLMLGFLRYITQNLDITPHHVNCNMAVVNVVVHKYYFEQVFTGFPLTSRFQRRQSSPKGVFIVHK